MRWAQVQDLVEKHFIPMGAVSRFARTVNQVPGMQSGISGDCLESDFSLYVVHKHPPNIDSIQNYTFSAYTSNNTDIYYPAVGILLRGNWDDCKELNALLKQNLPVILVSGSGGLADLIIEAIIEVGEDASQDIRAIFDSKILTPKKLKEYMELITDMEQTEEMIEKDIQDSIAGERKERIIEIFQLCVERYEKDIFIWDHEEKDFSDVLVKATLENDEVTERKISRNALLNVAVYCGELARARKGSKRFKT